MPQAGRGLEALGLAPGWQRPAAPLCALEAFCTQLRHFHLRSATKAAPRKQAPYAFLALANSQVRREARGAELEAERQPDPSGDMSPAPSP